MTFHAARVFGPIRNGPQRGGSIVYEFTLIRIIEGQFYARDSIGSTFFFDTVYGYEITQARDPGPVLVIDDLDLIALREANGLNIPEEIPTAH